MPANETPERLAAAAWIQVLPTDEGEVSAAMFGLRSQLSCQNRLIITSIASVGGSGTYADAPMIILPFDRVFSRRETTVHAQIVQTIDQRADRVDYPWRVVNSEIFDETDVNEPDTRVLLCPLHLDWIGDLAAPSWLPFGMGNGISSDVPVGFDLDLYNAMGLVPYGVGAAAVGMDICLHIFKHPPVLEDDTFELQQTLIIPVAG